MDPQTALWNLLDSMNRNDRVAVNIDLQALADWNGAGGFLPKHERVGLTGAFVVPRSRDKMAFFNTKLGEPHDTGKTVVIKKARADTMSEHPGDGKLHMLPLHPQADFPPDEVYTPEEIEAVKSGLGASKFGDIKFVSTPHLAKAAQMGMSQTHAAEVKRLVDPKIWIKKKNRDHWFIHNGDYQTMIEALACGMGSEEGDFCIMQHDEVVYIWTNSGWGKIMSEIKIFDGTPYCHNEQVWCFSVDEDTWARVMGEKAHVEECRRRQNRPSDLWLLFMDDLVPQDPDNRYRFKVTVEKL